METRSKERILAVAFQQLAKAMLPKEGKFEVSHDEDNGLYGVVEHDTWGDSIVYECDFTEPEAQIIAALMNQNEDLEWNDISSIVELFNENNFINWRED